MILRVLFVYLLFFFFVKQKTAYEMRISDWSSDVCSSDLGDLTLDLARRSATLAGKFISLSRREFAVLRLLAEHPGHILSRAQIEDRLYGWQEEVGSNAVEVHIHNLRAKLGRETIETVRGEGYRMPQR